MNVQFPCLHCSQSTAITFGRTHNNNQTGTRRALYWRVYFYCFSYSFKILFILYSSISLRLPSSFRPVCLSPSERPNASMKTRNSRTLPHLQVTIIRTLCLSPLKIRVSWLWNASYKFPYLRTKPCHTRPFNPSSSEKNRKFRRLSFEDVIWS